MLSFYKQQSYFSQIVSKNAKITISFFMKNYKNNNIILGFGFQFCVFGFSLSNKKNTNPIFCTIKMFQRGTYK